MLRPTSTYWYIFSAPFRGYRCPLVDFDEQGAIDDMRPSSMCELPNCVSFLSCHLVMAPVDDHSAGICLTGVIGFSMDKRHVLEHDLDKVFGRDSQRDMQWTRIEPDESLVMHEIHFVLEDPWEMRFAGTSVLLNIPPPLNP